MTCEIDNLVSSADKGRLSTFNRFENGSSSQGCADFNTRGLNAKDLKEIFRSNSETTGGTKADLVLKVYEIIGVLSPAANQQQNAADNIAQNDQDTRGDFKYDETLRRISALGWSTDLRQLPELNQFIQLYDYLVVSTRKYRHIVLKGTNYKKSYQFFFEGNVKRLESETHEYKT